MSTRSLLGLTATVLVFVSWSGVAAADQARPWWVFLADKGLASATAEGQAIDAAGRQLTPRAVERRRKAHPEAPVTLLDVPVSGAHVDEVLATGATERHRLRWLNAVTVNATDLQIAAIKALPFVARVKPVATQRHRFLEPGPGDRVERRPSLDRSTLNYGQCSSQILPIQVDQLHDLGLSGAGVRLAVFDTGFLRTHVAFGSLNVVGEWDFVQGDGNTANETGDVSNQHNHGTYVLSILAGFDPGNLIGPAYGADFLLAKTEDMAGETPAEEDNWVAAAQWADSLGADVISTSLAYIDWYTWADLDGDTATITIAADLAVANGITVLAAAGNEGGSSWFFIGPPADGDSVIAVGAVDSTGVLAGFSAHGPTIDARTKPDVCAMGSATMFALVSDNFAYSRGNGTSFSCPLTAGVAALLLEAHPTWGPVEVREALRSTASQAASPDNDYGWGIVRAFDASGYSTSSPVVSPATADDGRLMASPNPSAAVTVLRWSIPPGERVSALDIVDVAGRRVRRLDVPASAGIGEGALDWDGRDESGRPVPTGIYFARLSGNRGDRVTRVIRLR